MKKEKVIIWIIITLLITGVLFINFRTMKINNSEKSILLTQVNNMQNLDGGYHEFYESLGIYPEVYETYYSIQIMNLLGVRIDYNTYKEIGNWCDDLIKTDLFSYDKFNCIGDIYYLTGILKNGNIKLKDSQRLKILNYVNELQNEDGTFSFCKKDRNKISEGMKYLATYYAIKIRDNLNYKDVNFSKLNSWIKESFDKIFSSNKYNDSIEQASQLVLLIKISESINYDITKYNGMINKILKKCNLTLESACKENIEKLSVIDIDIILQLNSITKNKYTNDNCIKNINEYYYKLQKENGSFPIINSENGNILPTYLVVKYFKLFDVKIPNEKKLVNLISKNRIIKKGYVYITDIKSDIKTTFYSYNINKVLNNYTHNGQVYKYIKNIEKTNEYKNFNEDDFLKFDQICNDFRIKPQIDIDQVKYKINTLLNYDKRYPFQEYNNLLKNLEILELYKDNINENLKNKIFSLCCKDEINKRYDFTFENECFKLQIISILGYKDCKQAKQKINYILDILNNKIYKINPNLQFIYIYLGFDSLNKTNINIKEVIKNKNGIYDILRKCKDTNGMFKYSENDKSSIVSTYLGLYIDKNLK